MPALHKGIGLNAIRESRSAGVPPAMTNAGKMPALHRGIGLYAATTTTPVDGRLPPQAVFGPAFMPGSRGATPRPEAR